jgi:hypothetical protein
MAAWPVDAGRLGVEAVGRETGREAGAGRGVGAG